VMEREAGGPDKVTVEGNVNMDLFAGAGGGGARRFG
jgi:hypothetical protein